MKNKFTFKPLSFSDVPLMCQWYNLPHVQKFYSLRQWTEKEVLEKLKLHITGEKPVLGFIVLMGEDPIGYVQQYKISEQYEVSDYFWLDQNLSQAIVNNAAGMDLFIGDEKFIGKGIGSAIIKAFIESKIWSQFQYCVVDPDVRNISAIKCYEQLNFQDHAVIDTENELGQPVKLNLMILKRMGHLS
jgi:aminoglycoside 6'-N-acetyltransferase